MKSRCFIVLTGAVVAAGCAGTEWPGTVGTGTGGANSSEYRTLLNSDGELGIVNRLPAADYSRFFDAAYGFPTYDPASVAVFKVDVRSADLRSFDLLSREKDLMHATFDSKTVWPAKLPAGFEPSSIMELGKNPGLGIRALHAAGVTGKGVGIAIIDQGLLVDHEEYRERIRSYEEIHLGDRQASMHGPAVSSIAVGKTVGVAPEADLYYVAETHGVSSGGEFAWDLTYLADSIDRIRAINAMLPAEGKIRAISISLGISESFPNGDKALLAIQRAEEDGIYVIHCASGIWGLYRDPLGDPDALAYYGPGEFWASDFWSSPERYPAETTLLVPMDSRSTASPTGVSDYVFYASGGLSWTAPYVMGLYALACQINPAMTPALFRETVFATGTAVMLSHAGTDYRFGTIADPEKLIGALAQ